MLPPGLNTAREVHAYYDMLYEKLMASGQYQPFLYPWATMGFGVVLVYILIDHRQSPALRSLRFPLFGLLCAFSAWCILTNKARSAAGAYGVGLCSAFGTLWTAAIMFFNDCQTDVKRIERSDSEAVRKTSTKSSHSPVSKNSSIDQDDGRRQKLQAADSLATQGPHQRSGPIFWQSYPQGPILERLDWVVDLFCNLRGIGWTFETYGIPSPPSWVDDELQGRAIKSRESVAFTTSNTGIRRFVSRRALITDCLIQMAIGYIALDVIKVLMHHDAYFWGYMDAAAPTYLPDSIRTSYILLKSYRLLISLAAIYTALLEIFHLSPLIFCGLLGPSVLGLRGEPWMNPPDFYGSFALVLDKGLAGWWGGWWHQVFRFSFEAPTQRLQEALAIDKHSPPGKLLASLVAFFLSGCLHACGSYTQLGDTRPLLGPFGFFALQPVGILAQMLICAQLKKTGVTAQMPRAARRFGNLVAVAVWMYFTAPLLVDDFAKGGIWLYEPVMFSPLRALGFGAEDDNGWDLWYGLVFWRQGKRWWDTGIAF